MDIVVWWAIPLARARQRLDRMSRLTLPSAILDRADEVIE